MTNNGLKPLAMNAGELVTLLRDMQARIEAGDSFEGNIEYLIPDAEGEPPPGWGGWPDRNAQFWVRGVYRIGNTMGQGGMRMIGTVVG